MEVVVFALACVAVLCGLALRRAERDAFAAPPVNHPLSPRERARVHATSLHSLPAPLDPIS